MGIYAIEGGSWITDQLNASWGDSVGSITRLYLTLALLCICERLQAEAHNQVFIWLGSGCIQIPVVAASPLKTTTDIGSLRVKLHTLLNWGRDLLLVA